MRLRSLLVALAALGPSPAAVLASDYETDCATQVISYDNSKSGTWNNPQTVLKRPTVNTAGDSDMYENTVAVVPVFGPWMPNEIYRVGTGTSLVVKFDHHVVHDPRNPCGKDFIIFGNTIQQVGSGQYWLNGDPNLTRVQTTNLSAEPAKVFVSQDGLTWHEFTNGPYADDFAPTLGRLYDPEHYVSSLENNLWWGAPTIPTHPLDPTMTPSSFLNKTVAEVAIMYGQAARSAGGTSFDLSNVNPPLPPDQPWIQYVRVDQQGGVTPEIDAFADVAPMPDFDHDGDVDQEDFALLQRCMGVTDAAADPECSPADLNDDNQIDGADFIIFDGYYSGPNVHPYHCTN